MYGSVPERPMHDQEGKVVTDSQLAQGWRKLWLHCCLFI